MSESFFLEGGEPLAAALEVARRAGASLDAVDAAYGEVLALVAADDAALWATLAAEHVSVVRSAGLLADAAARCDQHLADTRARNRVPLLIERAQVRSESGAHAGAAADAATVREAADLDTADHARLRRVEGLAEAAAGDRATAERYLNEAREAFEDLGDAASAATLDADLRLLAARGGDDRAASDILAQPHDARSAPQALARALALKSQYRYEEALQLVVTTLAAEDLEPAMRLPLLEELVGLLIALRRGKALRALAAELPTALLRAGGSSEGTEPPAVRFLRTLLAALTQLEAGDVDQAGYTLDAARVLATTERDRAHWHLASGEVSIAAFKRHKQPATLTEAIHGLTAAEHHAEATNLLELRIRALRLLGEACELAKDPDQATHHWATAHALEEDLVARQLSDEVRATLLEDNPNEHDERIRVAADLANAAAPAATAAGTAATTATAVAAAIVAMESARGAAILSRVAPDAESALRKLPAAADPEAAWAWLRGIADATARDEAIWIMHARPDRIHHGIVGRGLVHHVDLPANRRALEKLVKELRKQCNEYRLRQPAGRAHVSQLIDSLATAIGADTVLSLVPRRIKRLVVVAGGVLSDIPLAALPINAGRQGETVPIVCRFALSDLPCVSVRPLLHQRSVGNRGERSLQISAFEEPIEQRRGRKVLTKATLEDFEQELHRQRYRKVRILGHGQTDPQDASRTWLQFAVKDEKNTGRVQPTRFQKAELTACGTLILGACESGMAQRVGRDERTGFVRAGLHAGAASVVAARWIAEVSVTAALLDRFESYIRHLPRDEALRRAQLDIRERRVQLAADVPEPDHPAWWACWTLYGDSGHQVKAPILRASARRPALLIRRLFRTF